MALQYFEDQTIKEWMFIGCSGLSLKQDAKLRVDEIFSTTSGNGLRLGIFNTQVSGFVINGITHHLDVDIALSSPRIQIGLNETQLKIQDKSGNNLIIIEDANKLSFYGAPTIVRPAHPVTLGDVITLLTNLGLCAP